MALCIYYFLAQPPAKCLWILWSPWNQGYQGWPEIPFLPGYYYVLFITFRHRRDKRFQSENDPTVKGLFPLRFSRWIHYVLLQPHVAKTQELKLGLRRPKTAFSMNILYTFAVEFQDVSCHLKEITRVGGWSLCHQNGSEGWRFPHSPVSLCFLHLFLGLLWKSFTMISC